MIKRLIEFITSAKRESEANLSDFSGMLVDMHSHLIPGIDDGVKNIETSIRVLQQMASWGFRKVITTPHVIADGYNNSTETILKGRDEIRKAIDLHQVPISFEAAAEYYLDATLFEKIEKRDILTLNDDYVLTEISYYNKPNNIYDLVYKMQAAGYKVILAHPERYPYYYTEDLNYFKELKNRNVYFQVNMMSLIGKYGVNAKTTAEDLVDNNMVEFIGSDLHGARHLPLLQQCLKNSYFEKIVNSSIFLNKTLI